MADFPEPGEQPNAYAGPDGSAGWLPTILKVLAGLAGLLLLACLLLPAVRTARPAAYRNACSNQLRQINVALLNYAHTHGEFPPAYTTDAEGKPLHSWRTLILPYLEEARLYKSIDFSKPWDDPANAAVLATRVDAYQCPADASVGNHSSYLAVVTPRSFFRVREPRKLADVQGALGGTLVVIEVDAKHAVPWMAPVDADESLVMQLGRGSAPNHAGGTNVALADGTVEFLAHDTPAAQLRAMISVGGRGDANGAAPDGS